MRFTASFVDPGQWNEIRAQLLDTPGVDALEIATVSDRDADVSLRFPGGVRGLADALGARGLVWQTLRAAGFCVQTIDNK